MSLQLHISYRTVDGRYGVALCHLDQDRIPFPNEFAQQWVLRNVPGGASLLGVRMDWAPLYPEDAVLSNVRRRHRVLLVASKEMPNGS